MRFTSLHLKGLFSGPPAKCLPYCRFPRFDLFRSATSSRPAICLTKDENIASAKLRPGTVIRNTFSLECSPSAVLRPSRVHWRRHIESERDQGATQPAYYDCVVKSSRKAPLDPRSRDHLPTFSPGPSIQQSVSWYGLASCHWFK